MSFAYFAKRCGLILYTLLVVSLLVFGITQVLPADAAVMLLGEHATDEALQAVRQRLGLGAPVWQQYGSWLAGVAQGDFGLSLRSGQPIAPALFDALGDRKSVV